MQSVTRISAGVLALTILVSPVFAGEREAPVSSGTTATDDLLPPNAKSGECYARVYTPPVYKTEHEQVLKRAASESVRVIPAKFETGQETILVREVSKRLEIIPATFEWVEEQVMIKPASTMLKQVPATFETVSEEVLERAAYSYWKRGTGPKQKINNATGEIMCLIEVPPVYRMVTKQVVKTPASVQEIEVPAVYTTERRQVVKTSPTTREIEIPAQHKTVTVTKLVEPAKEVRNPIAEEQQTISKTVMMEDAKLEWRSILCDTNMTPGNARKIQRALKAAGYNPGPIDGVIGQQTQLALHRFQTKHRLPTDDYVNVDTVKALQVSY